MDEPPLNWPGVLDPSLLPEEVSAAGHKMADAADAGDWPALFDLLDAVPALNVNQWRPGSPEWITPLHHAARHGAADVVAELVERGALRSLRDARGWTARDTALDQRHPLPLIRLLTPPPSPHSVERVRALDANLEWAIDGTIRTTQIFSDLTDHQLRRTLRYPPVAVLHEAHRWSVHVAIPGIASGIRVRLRRGYLETESAGRVQVITHRGAVLVTDPTAATGEQAGQVA